MTSQTPSFRNTLAAFEGATLVARGPLESVLEAIHARGTKSSRSVLYFDESTGVQMDFDLRGSWSAARERLSTHPALATAATPMPPRGPGRPKLGIACREVCLLPDQWDWLSRQSGGPSAALRRLVLAAMRQTPPDGIPHTARTALDKILLAVAGDLPGYEEASRTLWSETPEALLEAVAEWPDSLVDWIRMFLEDHRDTRPHPV